MSKFTELFEEYGFTVEPFGVDSYIADNGKYCIPFSEFQADYSTAISAVSFSSNDKEDIKKHYSLKDSYHRIGSDVYRDCSNNRCKFTHIGYIYNHDHQLYEIRMALDRMTK